MIWEERDWQRRDRDPNFEEILPIFNFFYSQSNAYVSENKPPTKSRGRISMARLIPFATSPISDTH
jgi:hypothetical protein